MANDDEDDYDFDSEDEDHDIDFSSDSEGDDDDDDDVLSLKASAKTLSSQDSRRVRAGGVPGRRAVRFGGSAGSAPDIIRLEHENHLITSSVVLSIGIVLMILISLVTWLGKGPRFVQGPFSLVSQVNYSAADQLLRFRRAVQRAQSTVTRSHLGSTSSESPIVWRRLTLVYEAYKADTFSSQGVNLIKAIELKLRSMPAWKSLCAQAPTEYRLLCEPGDSIVNVLYASEGTISLEDVSQGIAKNFTFDGLGSTLTIDPQTMVANLPVYSPGSALRWLPSDLSGPNAAKALRSTFSFALPAEQAGDVWQEFLLKHVIAELNQLGVMGMTAPVVGFFRAYLSADGLDSQERDLQAALLEEAPFLIAGPVISFLSAFIVTRRGLVALISGLLVVASVSIVSIGLLAVSDKADGIPRLSVTVTASWLCITLSVTDLCVACCVAAQDRGDSARLQLPQFVLARWANEIIFANEEGDAGPLVHRRRGGGQAEDSKVVQYHDLEQISHWLDEPRGIRLVILKGLRIFCEAVSPTLCVGITLCFISAAASDLTLVSEFSLHAGLGFLVSIPWAALLIPIAVDIGDVLAFRSRKNKTLDSLDFSEDCIAFLQTIFPMEMFGAPPKLHSRWKKQFREYFRAMVKSWWLRLLCLGATIAIIVSVARIKKALPIFTADTPDLFIPGHRLRDIAELLTLFAPLDDPMTTAIESLQDARFCSPWAPSSHDCFWFECYTPSGSSSVAATAKQCTCHFQEVGTGSSVHGPFDRRLDGCRSATARLWGLDDDTADTLLGGNDFWNWVSPKISANITETAVFEYMQISKLQYQDWAQGASAIDDGYSTSRGAASWAESCVQIICLCGTLQCSLPESMTNIGTFAPSLLSWKTGTVDSSSPVTTTETAIDAEGTMDILVAFGIEVSDAPLQKAQDGTFLLDTGVTFVNFHLEDMKAQRSLLRFCEGLSPDLFYLYQSCWPYEFKEWIEQKGLLYPLEPEEFYTWLWAYFDDWASTQYLARPPSFLVRDGGPYFNLHPGFWLDGNGQAKAMVHAFRVFDNVSRAPWERYYRQRNMTLPQALGKAFLVPPDSVLTDAVTYGKGRVTSIGLSAVLLLTLIPFVWTWILTWSFGLALASFVSEVLAIVCLDLSTAALQNSTIGVTEIASAIGFMSVFILELMRVSQQYAWTLNGPGQVPQKKIVRKSAKTSLGKIDRPFFDALALRNPEEAEFVTRSLSMDLQLSKTQKQVLKLRKAVVRGPPVFIGAIDNERVARAAAAAHRAFQPVVATTGAAVVTGLIVMASWMEALVQVCRFIYLGAAFALVVSMTFLPVLIVHLALGPSRVKGKALAYLYYWYADGKPLPPLKQVVEGKLAPSLGELGPLSAKVLGFPFTLLATPVPMPEPDRSSVTPKEDQEEKDDDENEDDLAPTLKSLEIIGGATIMPPYHLVTVAKGPFSSEMRLVASTPSDIAEIEIKRSRASEYDSEFF